MTNAVFSKRFAAPAINLTLRNLTLGAMALALASLASPLINPAAAVDYPYCANTDKCDFTTVEQCRAFLEGQGGICTRNPKYASSTPAAPSKRR